MDQVLAGVTGILKIIVYERVTNKGSLLFDSHFHEREDLMCLKLPLYHLKGYVGKKLENTNFLRNSITMITQQCISVMEKNSFIPGDRVILPEPSSKSLFIMYCKNLLITCRTAISRKSLYRPVSKRLLMLLNIELFFISSPN